MKLTDIAIVFELFFICLLTVVHIKSAYAHSMVTTEIMYNNVLDGIVEDALKAGFTEIDEEGKPIVDLEKVISCYMAERSQYGGYDRQILLYVAENGYYVWDSEKYSGWSELMEFSLGENTSHEYKILELTEYMEQTYQVDLSLPFNDGESWVNTVNAFSLLAVCINRDYDISCFSGARIHEVNE